MYFAYADLALKIWRGLILENLKFSKANAQFSILPGKI